MVVWESVPTRVSGSSTRSSPSPSSMTTLARSSRFTWWTMPVAGGTTRKRENASAPQRQEPVALLVPFELDRRVLAGRHRGAEGVHHHRVVDDQVHRRLGVDPRRVAAHAGQRGPHGGQVHERGNPREVLQDDAGRAERDLAPGRRCRVPGREGGHVLFPDRPSVHPAKQRFQEHPDRERQPGDGAESFPAPPLRGRRRARPRRGCGVFPGTRRSYVTSVGARGGKANGARPLRGPR